MHTIIHLVQKLALDALVTACPTDACTQCKFLDKMYHRVYVKPLSPGRKKKEAHAAQTMLVISRRRNINIIGVRLAPASASSGCA